MRTTGDALAPRHGRRPSLPATIAFTTPNERPSTGGEEQDARRLGRQARALLTALDFALRGTSTWRFWLMILSAAALLTVTTISSIRARRVRRWLDAHPEQVTGETTSA